MIEVIISPPAHDWQAWAQPFISGGVMACILTMIYLWQENRKRVGYAKMLAIELREIRDIVSPFSMRGVEAPTAQPGVEPPRGYYDGLVSSSGVAYFDVRLQVRLRSFYKDVDCHKYARLRRNVGSLREEVNRQASASWHGHPGKGVKRAFKRGR